MARLGWRVVTARRASWLVLLVVLSIALAIGASGTPGPASQAERVEALTRTIKCPTCPSQSVAESDVPLAREIRIDLAERVEAGQADDEIRDYYVSRYGQEVMLNPPRSGIAGLVWVLPVAALVVAAVVLVATFRRWSANGSLEATDDDRALVAQALVHDDSSAGGAVVGAASAHDGGEGTAACDLGAPIDATDGDVGAVAPATDGDR